MRVFLVLNCNLYHLTAKMSLKAVYQSELQQRFEIQIIQDGEQFHISK